MNSSPIERLTSYMVNEKGYRAEDVRYHVQRFSEIFALRTRDMFSYPYPSGGLDQEIEDLSKKMNELLGVSVSTCMHSLQNRGCYFVSQVLLNCIYLFSNWIKKDSTENLDDQYFQTWRKNVYAMLLSGYRNSFESRTTLP